MNVTQPITSMSLPADLDANLLSAHAELVESLTKIGNDQNFVQALLSHCHATEPDEIDGAIIGKTRENNAVMLDLLRRELKVRTELAKFYKTLPAAFGALCDRRRAASKNLHEELCQKLAELGFENVEHRFLLQHAGFKRAVDGVDAIRDRVVRLSRQEVDNEGSQYRSNAARCDRIRTILSAALANAGIETSGALY